MLSPPSFRASRIVSDISMPLMKNKYGMGSSLEEGIGGRQLELQRTVDYVR